MLKYPCLILDHDDTAVQSEATVNYPFFCTYLDQVRPGTKITLQEYAQGCYDDGFEKMCRKKYGFTAEEAKTEYLAWQSYIKENPPLPFPGMDRIIRRQKEQGGRIFVVSHSCVQNITRDYNAYFHVLPDGIYGWELPTQLRKPSPYAVTDIMEKYGYKKEEILVVDDMKPAYTMAHAAGVSIGFAAWGREDSPALYKEMSELCNYTFRQPADLERFLFD